MSETPIEPSDDEPEVCEACGLEPEDGEMYTTDDDVRLCFQCYADVPIGNPDDIS